jgi:uncharacterized RDD family membrane protein YckC
MRQAPVVIRLLASLADLFLITLATLWFVFFISDWFEEEIAAVLSFLIILIGVAALFFRDVMNGQSIGKRFFRIMVRNQDYTMPNRKQLIMRNISSMFWPRDIHRLLNGNGDKRKAGDIRYGTDVFQNELQRRRIPTSVKVIAAIIVGAILFVFSIQFLMKQDGSYRTAIQSIEDNQEIRAIVGDNMRFGYWMSGSMSKSGGAGDAAYSIKVKGDSKQQVVVTVGLTKEPGYPWKVSHFSYE